MSLSRQFFRELRPLFRLLDEPFGMHSGFPSSLSPARSLLHDPTFGFGARVPVDVSEEANQYIIEAELPGVRKEDLDVNIADGGRTVRIEGKIVSRANAQSRPESNGSHSTSASPTEGMPAKFNPCFCSN
jgi:HSP20 family molecular chaperone IbpA